MQKRIPHCKLTTIKALIQANKVTATASAVAGARLIGIQSLQAMCDVVMTLTRADFYKSMTTDTDHRVWQDVYHGRARNGLPLYIKLTVMDGVLIVSFKEL